MEDETKKIDKIIAELDANENVIKNEDGTKTVLLTETVSHNGSMIDKVTFRKPRGKDLRVMDMEKGDLAKGFRLAASLSGLSFATFDEMTGDDAMLCTTVASTMGKKLITGEKP